MLEIKNCEVKSVYIDSTDYCEEARLDTQLLISIFEASSNRNRYVVTKNAHQADYLIYNACGHLQSKQDESLRDIKELLKLKKDSAELIVWGCLPKINPASLRNVYRGPIVGPEDFLEFFCDHFNLASFEETNIQANTLNDHCKLGQKTNMRLTRRQKLTSIYDYLYHKYDIIANFKSRKTRKNTWYIKIVSGCSNSCTYCSDRLAYNLVRSQSIESIMKQFKLGLNRGYKDFLFVGRDLGSYGHDIGITLPNLLDVIISKYKKIDFRIFLRNVSPISLINMYPELELILPSKKIVYLGSHIQSGSNKILRLMGKRCSLSKWVEIIGNIRKNFPWIFLETSIMVGFPSEKEKDFEKSVNLVNYLNFDRIVLYKYNERPNLPSLRIKNRLSEDIKDERYYRILNHVTAFKAREQIKPSKIFSFNVLISLSNLAIVLLRRFLRKCCSC